MRGKMMVSLGRAGKILGRRVVDMAVSTVLEISVLALINATVDAGKKAGEAVKNKSSKCNVREK